MIEYKHGQKGTLMYTDYKIGQTVWVHTGADEKESGVIVHSFEWYNTKQYVVEFQTHIDPVLYVYNALTMSPTKEGLIGFWSNFKEL